MFFKRFYCSVPKINNSNLKKYKYYCDSKYNSCHCLHYGDGCRYVYNKLTYENFEKYLLYITQKNLEKKNSKKVYEKLLKDWI